jgi:iron-sulfur cluster assembly protein
MEVSEQTTVNLITLTPAAAEAVQQLLSERNLEGYALRVYVAGGSCSGYQYGMALEDSIRAEDMVSEQHGVQIVVDEISINYLNGATIDYVNAVTGNGFKIDNPNAMSTCGCSSSSQSGNEPGGMTGGCSCQ